MTDTEKALKREVLTLRIELAKAQAALLQRMHDDAAAELKAMDAAQTEPAPLRAVDSQIRANEQ
jgi:hypothetical protein